MSYIKTDHDGLVRDTNTYAIINTNEVEYKSFMQNRKNSNQIKDIEKDLNALKKDFVDIKEMLIELLNRK